MFGFLDNVIYVQLSPERLTVREPKAGRSFSDVPEAAVHGEAGGGRPEVVAVGQEARRALPSGGTPRVVNPFAHPRSVISDFSLGVQVLNAFVRRLCGRRLFSPSPRFVMHVRGEVQGGLTELEVRALREMALGVGASRVAVWQGRELTDEELISGGFPADGQVLD